MAFTYDIGRSDRGLGGRVRALIAAMHHHKARRAAYRQTYDELSALSDRELTDLGLARADIRTIARQAADEI